MLIEFSQHSEVTTGNKLDGLTALQDLEEQLTLLAGHLNAGNYRFLKVLAEFERREGHAGWGINSCAHWLSWKCGIGLVAAREKCRVARALEDLPQISDAMRRGTISYCKVRAITRVATPENEELLLQVAEHATVTQVEKTVRLYRRGERARELATANQLHDERFVQYFVDDQGCIVLRGRFAPEQGALVMRAIQAANDALREAEHDSREAYDVPDRPVDGQAARRADALALLAETYLASGAAPLAAGDRHIVNIHVDEQVLRHELAEGRCELEDTVALPPATIRRLCCDGTTVAIVEDAEDNPLNVGRKKRAISPALRRALEARDVGCRYPGCTNTRFTDAHHIIHWADGGETNLDNLILLCRRHHRYVHEHGFTIQRAGPELHFIRPDGRRVLDVPRPHSSARVPTPEDLIQANHDDELDIEATTGIPHWRGEDADYDWLLRALHARDDDLQTI